MLQRSFWFPRNRPKSLIHMDGAPVLKNSASQAQGPKIKGLAPAEAVFNKVIHSRSGYLQERIRIKALALMSDVDLSFSR